LSPGRWLSPYTPTQTITTPLCKVVASDPVDRGVNPDKQRKSDMILEAAETILSTSNFNVNLKVPSCSMNTDFSYRLTEEARYT